MKKIIIVISLILISTNLFAQKVNGHLEEIDGKTVLTVWGNHQERGYAQGYLVGEDFLQVFDEYVLKYECGGSLMIYSAMRTLFEGSYQVEKKYQIEAGAMLQALSDKNIDLYNDILGRDVDTTDILMCTAIVDLSQRLTALTSRMGCSSISSWGASTEESMGGSLLITRLLDWSPHPALYENSLLVVHIPNEKNEQKWISFTFPGFLGALSGVNQAGVGAFMNMGNKRECRNGEFYDPILLSVRNGVETYDYNQDATNDVNDIVAAIQAKNPSSASIVHAVQDKGSNSKPLIIECNNIEGVEVRDYSANTMIQGHNLVATNHFISLYEAVTCQRYQGIAEALENSSKLSPQRSWDVIGDRAGIPGNIHAIQYIDSENIVKWAVSKSADDLAYSQEPTVFNLDSLFAKPRTSVSAENALATTFQLDANYPNPFNPSTTIEFHLDRRSKISLQIYNALGAKITTLVAGQLEAGLHKYSWNAGSLPSGLYFYRLQSGENSQMGKMVLLK